MVDRNDDTYNAFSMITLKTCGPMRTTQAYTVPSVGQYCRSRYLYLAVHSQGYMHEYTTNGGLAFASIDEAGSANSEAKVFSTKAGLLPPSASNASLISDNLRTSRVRQGSHRKPTQATHREK